MDERPDLDGQKSLLVASTDCPRCGGFVSLSGRGCSGEEARLTGVCPNGHVVYFNQRIP
jgi:hypothetical protein